MKELLWYDGQITETGRDGERGNYCLIYAALSFEYFVRADIESIKFR